VRPFSGRTPGLAGKMSDFANKKSLFCLRSLRSQPLKNKLMEKSTVTWLETIQTSPVTRQAPRAQAQAALASLTSLSNNLKAIVADEIGSLTPDQ
jgi:hypothetical protein